MTEAIAIIGVGGVFPGSADPAALWDHVLAKRNLARELPAHRAIAPLDALFNPTKATPDKLYAKRGYYLDDAHIAPDVDDLLIDGDELEPLDPLFKLAVHAAQQAARDAKLPRQNHARAGVILGNIVLPTESASAWARETLGADFASRILGRPPAAPDTDPRNARVAGLPADLVARALGLQLGGYTLDAACASSLYAVKLAVDELRSGRADLMLTGGLSRPDCLYTQMGFSQLTALSPTGSASPFDTAADGLVVGEGAGLFVLKRLGDAERDGDHIYAVIRGVGLANDVDGGLLAPSSEGQLRAMRAAYDSAGWNPWDVDLIECHATGTPLGDTVEIQSLQQLWENAPEDLSRDACVLGSIKSNVGHLLTAAGATSLTRALYAIQTQTLPPTANFETPKIPLGPFEVLSEARPWQSDRPRRAAVSAFGFGGINAHLLIEEYVTDAKTTATPTSAPTQEPIAVIGLEAKFGDAQDLAAFQQRVFSLNDDTRTIDAIHMPLRFRIPPNELKEMLPQQLLMLLTAVGALEDAGLEPMPQTPRERAGVFIGLGLDHRTTHYQFRWDMPQKAQAWAHELGLNLDETQLEAWIDQLRQASGPALNANRVIGGLGSITASRIARECRIGGPSFTIAAEEASALRAVEAAVRALQQGDLDLALAGAVDLAAETRQHRADTQLLGTNEPGDGAAAFVLKRLQDAERDGDQIYAVIDGIGQGPDAKNALAQALQEADAGALGLIETAGDFSVDDTEQPPSLGRIDQVLGHTGAASGAAGLVRTCLALKGQLIPPHRAEQEHITIPQKLRPWLRNRIDGPRRAAVIANGGVHQHGAALTLREHGEPLTFPQTRDALIFVEGDTPRDLADTLQQLVADAPVDLHELEVDTAQATKPLVVALIAADREEFRHNAAVTVRALRSEPAKDRDFGALQRAKRVVYNPKPMGADARIAFVWPGSGSHFEDMGRQLALHFPQVPRDMDTRTNHLAHQLRPEYFWNTIDLRRLDERRNLLLSAQVALGVLAHDSVRLFGVKPAAAIGYSLGESSMMFSTRAWTDRDRMHLRTQDSPLFTHQLAGSFDAAKAHWGLPDDAQVDWAIGVIPSDPDKVRAALKDRDRVYLLIVNTPRECVIGGDREAVEQLAADLKARLFPLHGVVSVHCEVLKPVEQAYYEHHLYPTTPPDDLTYYSCGHARAFELNREAIADAIRTQARDGIDFPKTIRAAYDDGFNVFLEMGPGASCTRMIHKILKGERHVAVSACAPNRSNFLYFLATLISERIPLDLRPLQRAVFRAHRTPVARALPIAFEDGFGEVSAPARHIAPRADSDAQIVLPASNSDVEALRDKVAKPLGDRVGDPLEDHAGRPLEDRVGGPLEGLKTNDVNETHDTIARESRKTLETPHRNVAMTRPTDQTAMRPVAEALTAATSAKSDAHEVFLRIAQKNTDLLTNNLQFQMTLIQSLGDAGQPIPQQVGHPQTEARQETPTPAPQAQASQEPASKPWLDRDGCLEFARGRIAPVLGPDFAEIDTYPTRVRLPDEPLMLVDRITDIGGEWMDSGHIVTEHDVLVDGWYLDCGRIPTSISIESGQADLFLSAYLGVDFETKGLSTYRLLDAQVTFHDHLPQPGKTIVYDIRIKRFFRQADTHFFYFEFEGSVDGKPLLTMRNGCAGFFSPAELEAGKGVVRSQPAQPSKPQSPWRWTPAERTTLDRTQLTALRNGDLSAAFGAQFANLAIQNPVTLPSGKLDLVHRVTDLDPSGGDYGLGLIKAEADIHPDDWFLTCHFVDDMVMPGTLMYECCLHTLRVFLYRMGWIGEQGQLVCEPKIGVRSQLKCRGQVLTTTKVAGYEIHIKKIGFDPEPYAIADAIMYSDHKAVVDITDMCIAFTGLTEAQLDQLWAGQTHTGPVSTYEQLLAFAIGKPSEAFGDRYQPFDQHRRIARFPNPPFLFMTQVNHTDVAPWALTEDGKAEVQYDIPPDAWYFRENRTDTMAYSVLLEIALQSCGWMAAYMGSATYSTQDLQFRNLGGTATQHRAVTAQTGSLWTDVTVTKISKTNDVILQFFQYQVRDAQGPIFTGDTYFGFFTPQALANQVGLTDHHPFTPEITERRSFPTEAPFPADMMRMIHHIDTIDEEGGTHNQGFIQTSIDVDPSAWFFKAHFYEDPVWPGSLGIESFLQTMMAFAANRWGATPETTFEVPGLEAKHEWIYRGQITPSAGKVEVQAHITKIDESTKTIEAEGYLLVDGLAIYEMKQFTLRLRNKA